jgi:hypothetical protein
MTRCMKVRWRPRRVSCGHVVFQGQKIHSKDGVVWICEPCALAAVRATTTGRTP